MSNRQLRIAFDNSLTRRNLTGTRTYALHLIQELSSAPELNLKVFNGPDMGGHRKGLAARIARGMASLYWRNLQFPQLLREGDFDVLHGPAFVVPTRCSTASVVTVHDLTFRLFPGHFKNWWGAYVTYQMPWVLQSVSAIVCVSEHTKKDLLNFYNIPPSKVHVVYSGVDHARFHPDVRLDPTWAQWSVCARVMSSMSEF